MKLIALVMIVAAAGSVQAGLLSRAHTQGERLDDAKPISVDGIYVYSFLQDGSDNSRRLERDIEKYRKMVDQMLHENGVRVASKALPAGTLKLDVTLNDRSGPGGHVRELQHESRETASDVARAFSDEEAALPIGYRLLLLPERVAWSSGRYYFGGRKIDGRPTVWSSKRYSGGGVPHYSFRVLWLLEDVNENPIAAGSTTGTLDIRGFPAKPMVSQMLEELENLGVQWSGATSE